MAILVRDFGDLDLAEEAAQDAFLEAAARWRSTGRPDQPGAWLTTTARRKAIDRLRRATRLQDRLAHLPESAHPLVASDDAASQAERAPTGLVDDQLALLLGCCHPALGVDAQVALTLRAVAGLSVRQIARAFLVGEATMEKRLVRAKSKIRTANIPFRVPDRDVLVERLDTVRHVVSLIFNEGHTRSHAGSLVHGDLCDEAAWLADLLVHLAPDDPENHGLAALIALTDARRHARVDTTGDATGHLVLLADQDRSKWDRSRIEHGKAHLAAAYELHSLGPYQLEAAIAAVHATTPTFDDTDWRLVVQLYDALVAHAPSPVVELNRAVAISYRDGPAAGLAALEPLAPKLTTYLYYHAAHAELLLRVGRRPEATAAFELALEHCTNNVERRHLTRRRDEAR